ncbi:hypothetical protein B484DRAFT_407740 [Ochromonadaceae sp. CCMP2298]|nr:hypothetical protein B484DRAFT_407740 [Ochromonadaceae sp. CCMP2298]
MDGDSDIDIVSSTDDFPNAEITWWENDGNNPPSFTRRTVTDTAATVHFVIAVDLDQDGDIDIVSAEGYAVGFYDNSAAPSSQPSSHPSSQPSAQSAQLFPQRAALQPALIPALIPAYIGPHDIKALQPALLPALHHPI